jgi:hypothetical protein
VGRLKPNKLTRLATRIVDAYSELAHVDRQIDRLQKQISRMIREVENDSK